MSTGSTPPLGFIEEDKRTNEQQDTHLSIMNAMPKFSMPKNFFGATPPNGTKVLWTDLWKHPKVIKVFGKAFFGIWQLTGSCVGAAGGNVVFTQLCIDIVKNNERETPVMPFWLYPYGISRKLAGFKGKGEGSLGSTFVKALTQYGCPSTTDPALKLPMPKSNTEKGICWTEDIEYQWSDGNFAPQSVRDVSKTKLIRTATPVYDAVSVRDSILNGYCLTRAAGGTNYVEYGTATVREGACIGRHNGRGGHQMSWLGYWHHPILGELIWEQNQWSGNAYPVDPAGGARGGCWITMDAVQRICDSKEVFSFSQYDGYPAQPDIWDWDKQRVIG